MKEDIFYCGLDVSKGYVDLAILDAENNVIASVSNLPDTPEGHKKLKLRVENLLESQCSKVLVGVESTGGYENNWVNTLVKWNERVQVYRLNPVRVKHLMSAQITRSVDDGVSARSIARCLQIFATELKPLTGSAWEKECFDGRQKLAFIDLMVKQKTQTVLYLNQLLYQHLPELLTLFKYQMPHWVFELVSKYNTRKKIIKARKSTLSKIKGLRPEKLETLKETINPSKEMSSSVSMLIQQVAINILNLDQQVKAMKKDLCEPFEDHPVVELLTTIPGVGKYTAVVILLEVGDIERFATPKKLAAYFGLNPTLKSSGDGSKKMGMSKKGRSRIRAALFMSCKTGVQYSPILKKTYALHKSRGKNYYQTMGVIMHKLLRIVYGVWKNNTPYDDQKAQNDQKKSSSKERTQTKQNMEEIELLKNGPISSRKRREISKQADVPIE